ncbi:nucleotidyltransferase domain-containing protein [Calidifontibacter sp. DB0510]|uniref:Nucleotidyltransferase domain-containing protein n=1 Tax=Metallococcus carri TaxID=1656884 RepID=A0A967AYY4_9MICO|nr:nucleotidyltransferase domain-containing protein [Metallococcus carri]NHN54298.1 nucleotidyltransferase domain-containing protein [Metallococcus carri]NOP36862.1 nucleotidyltransferase domain-containing protein [Calidifontibacter sp. DB2511S]
MRPDLHAIAADLVTVDGVLGVTLGGSRARGDALPESDADLGVYYRGPLDLVGLQQRADAWSSAPASIAGPGEWGPWVDGGAWLTVDGVAVDWILRDVDRVAAQCDRALRGEFAFHAQAGHPLGFLDIAYAGELASSVLLADPSRQLAALRARLTSYPAALRTVLIEATWEADFLVGAARKGVPRGDRTYVLTCLTRAILLCAHGIQAAAGQWVTNEKGLVAAAATAAEAPPEFARRADLMLADPDLGTAIGQAEALVHETRTRISTASSPRGV